MSRPPRFIVEIGAIANGAALVTGRELHHLRDVRRLEIGDVVELIE
jgi:16S rRNA U1498 N3-methylase RsmE